ncbi:MAG: hypothetical protein JXB62_19170 [Pirellulales bacterium]|nr:hypothetical protein [Pirellulales bacterium]
MFSKLLSGKMALRALILAAAIGGPIAYFSPPESWKDLATRWFASGSKAIAGDAGATASDAEQPVDPGTPTGVEGPRVQDLAEVLRFDVTSDWILRRWPRVSTGLAHLRYQGYRVPLVTGTQATDLAGSLTYYFDPQQKVQRITFYGTTGDARQLVNLLTTRYRFTHRLANDPGLALYEAKSASGRPSGVLSVTSAGIIKASDPHRKFEVELVIERPS